MHADVLWVMKDLLRIFIGMGFRGKKMETAVPAHIVLSPNILVSRERWAWV